MTSSNSELLRGRPVQAILAMPALLVLFFVEARLIRRLLRQDAFSTVHPISLGV